MGMMDLTTLVLCERRSIKSARTLRELHYGGRALSGQVRLTSR